MKRILISTILFAGLSFGFSRSAACQPTGIFEKAFFYNDIYHFVGRPYKSPSFDEVKTFAQPFQMKCSHLNRIILPFYINDNSNKTILTFNLFQIEANKALLYSISIDTGNFPHPKKMGTHHLEGIFYTVWFPPVTNSKNKSYIWELTNEKQNDENSIIGIYLTNKSHHQLKPVIIDGTTRKKSFTAFYAYCQYRFNWNEILKTTLVRFDRERYFLGIYFLMIGGLVIYIKKVKK